MTQSVSSSSDPATQPSRTSPLDARYHLAAIVDSSDDPIISKDLNGIVISWNPAATRVFDYQPDEIIGQSIFQIVPPELHHEEEEILRKLKAGERIEHYETIRMKKNGDRFPVSITIWPIKDDTGQVIGASKVARDISDRHKTDQSKFRLAAIVDSADDAIVSKNLNGIVSSWNEGARRMFGYTAEEMIGQSILRLIPEELQYEEDEILRTLRSGGRVDHYETTRRRKNGERIDVSVTISPIMDETGQVIGASKIARDISDRKRIQQLLIQSEKLAATGRMAAAIAHEINNPLESVVNLIYLARLNSGIESKAHRFLLTAEQELERISHIARQTLGYYRDTGAPSEVYLHDLVQNVLTVYQAKLLSSGITVDSCFNDLQKIVVSKGEILQVFSNIIANAIEAMPQGGVLNIAIRKLMNSGGDGIQTIIRDNGVGIEAKHLERVFEPFFTTKIDIGTGIGLWVSKQLIEKRGGQISIASTTEPGNSGTSITIFIPLIAPSRASGPAETEAGSTEGLQ